MVISSDFKFKPKLLQERLREHKDYKNYTITLMEAKALKVLCKASRYSAGKILPNIKWGKIFSMEPGEVILITEADAKSLMEQANTR